MKEKLSQNPLSLVSLSLVTVLLVVLGLMVLPFTDGFVVDTKVFGFLLFSLLLVLSYTAYSLKHKGFQIVLSPLLLPTAFFGLVVLLSALIAKPYPVEELLGYGGLWLAAVLTIIVGGSFLPKKTGAVLTAVLGGIAVALTLFSGLQLLGFGPAQALNWGFGLSIPTTLAFTLVGPPLVALQVQVIAAALLVGKIISSKFKSIVSMVALAIVAVGIALHAWAILPGQQAPADLPPVAASWSIALDTLRSPRSAIIGEGPSSFANSYRRFKPLSINTTEQWSATYASASNAPLTVLATMGILGFIAWVFVMVQAFKEARAQRTKQLSISLAIFTAIIVSLLLPPTPVMIAINALLLAALIAGTADKRSFHLTALVSMVALNPSQINLSKSSVTKSPAWPVYILSALLVVASVLGIYGLGRSYYSLMLVNQANRAAAANDALALYNAQQQAVQMMPYLDALRRSYAITNVLIATGLANAQNVTEEQQTQIGELLQQAVREARAAAYLDPTDADNWAVLAQVYQTMIGVAEDAEQWTVQAFLSAIEANPGDPQLRIALGGLLLSQNQPEQALAVFEQAINIKPDFANSYYNAAQALIALNRLADAQVALQSVLNLLDPNSEDFTRVTTELETLQERLSAGEEQLDNEASASGVQTPSLLDQQLNTPASNTVAPPAEDQNLDIDAETAAPTAAPDEQTTN